MAWVRISHTTYRDSSKTSLEKHVFDTRRSVPVWKMNRCHTVDNLINIATIIIYDSRVVKTRKLLILQSKFSILEPIFCEKKFTSDTLEKNLITKELQIVWSNILWINYLWFSLNKMLTFKIVDLQLQATFLTRIWGPLFRILVKIVSCLFCWHLTD